MSKTWTALFDKKSLRPACVLLQAMAGGERQVCFLFSEWEVQPTDTMVRITATEAEWRELAKRIEQRAAQEKGGG